VRFLLSALFVFSLAAAVGLGATWFAVNGGLDMSTLSVGAWRANPKAGTADIDPYSRAQVAHSGILPTGIGDGVAFVAATDDKGRPLDGRCAVTLAGVTPAARFFTLTLYDPAGRLVANVLGRSGFTSEELIRNGDGSFAITIAPRPYAGNWLPTGGIERYVLVLRLYDTPVGVATRAGRETPMPAITRGRCA